MQYKTFPITITYDEQYIPPRCRKPRYREAEAKHNIRIRKVTKAEAPVAFVLSDYHHTHEGQVKVRLYKGKFYILDTWQHYAPGPEGHYGRGEFVGFRPTTEDCFLKHFYITNTRDSLENQKASYHKEALQYLIIDGLVWKQCGEPLYEIQTFGLGNNHGGTALFVETCYNPNIGKDRYFNALLGDEAVATMNAIAQRRGDTKSVGRYGKMIKVLIPECVKRNPLREHGDGDPFINLLNDITDNASSPMEAGLLAIIAATK